MKVLPEYQNIWLVGASTGIGEALLRELDHPSRTIFISARSASLLQTLAERAKGRVIALPMDMNDEAQVCASVDQIAEAGGLDMAILNAGICEYMDSAKLDMDMLRRVMETNFFSVARLMSKSMDLLRMGTQRGLSSKPKLVVMSSSVSYQALPRAHAYGASKAALRYFTECLKMDVQKEGIDVRVISPGFVQTPLTDRNDFPMPGRITAQQAAKRILDGLSGSTFDIHFPKRFTWSVKALASVPNTLKFKILGALSRHSNIH